METNLTGFLRTRKVRSQRTRIQWTSATSISQAAETSGRKLIVEYDILDKSEIDFISSVWARVNGNLALGRRFRIPDRAAADSIAPAARRTCVPTRKSKECEREGSERHYLIHFYHCICVPPLKALSPPCSGARVLAARKLSRPFRYFFVLPPSVINSRALLFDNSTHSLVV